MAFAEVGSGSQRATKAAGTDGATLAYPANVASGSVLVCMGACWHATTAPTSIGVTDTITTPYTVVLGTVVGTWRPWIAFGIAPSSAANTITIEPNGIANVMSFSIDEFSGTTPVASVEGGSTTASDSTASDAITTATDNELILGVMSHDGSTNSLTPAATQTQIGEDETNAADQCHNACFRIATTATSYTMSWTIGISVDNVAQTYSLKETAGVTTRRYSLPTLGVG